MRPREAVRLPGLTRACAYRVGIPILSLAPVGEGGLGLRAHSSELAAHGRRVQPCVRRTSVVVETLALPARAAPHGRRVARPLSGAASGDWRATGDGLLRRLRIGRPSGGGRRRRCARAMRSGMHAHHAAVLTALVVRWRGRCMPRGQRPGGWFASTLPARVVLWECSDWSRSSR